MRIEEPLIISKKKKFIFSVSNEGSENMLNDVEMLLPETLNLNICHPTTEITVNS